MAASHFSHFSTRSILVVEDSPTQAAALSALLEEHDYVVHSARSGEEALITLHAMAAASQPPVDLVLSDVVMPGMSGYQLCRAIKEDAVLRNLPVMLLTSLTDPLDIIRGLECGADNYITKPYDATRLINRLQDVFVNRELRRVTPGDGVSITFLGERFTVTSNKEQILDLLVSSFEELVRTNQALRASEAERAQLYERERTARMDAEAANRAKSDFLTSMSHDLRTPLNAIGGYAELMTEEVQGPVNDAQRGYLERIIRNQKHLLALVNDVLNFARVERGQVTVQMTHVPVEELLAGARAVIEPQMLDKGLTYSVTTCNAEAMVHADRERADQVLINLLGNAVKFTPRGGRIGIACVLTEQSVTLEVSDTGIGIPADRHEAIFDPFVQVDARRTTEQQGIGLGLAISRNLARLMGGELTVESTIGKGSTFALRLERVT